MHQHIMSIILIVSNHVTYLDQIFFFCETQLFDGHVVYH
jgi:1-acyl-sn-glycerol-3-phosphate acyltransferase